MKSLNQTIKRLALKGASLLLVLCSSFTLAANNSISISETSLSLEDFYTAAMDYSPRLNIAKERWNINTARTRARNGQLLPQISANANINDNRRTSFNQFTQQDDVSQYRGNRYSIQLRQVLFNWQAFSARSQAYLLEDQAEAEYYAELATILTEVAERYFDVLQAEDALRSIQTEEDAITNQLNQIQSAFDLQLVQITDLYAAQARFAAVLADKIDVESNLELSREALLAITNVPVNSLFLLAEDTEIPALEGTIREWVEKARSGNPLIQARGYALQAAGKRVSERRGAYMPNVSLVLQRQNSNIGFENAQINESDNTYIGVDISIPLYAGGSNRAAVSEAVSLRSIASSELQQAQIEVLERTRLSYLQVKSAEARTIAAVQLAESTETASTAMQRGFELGTVTSVDVLNALRDQFQAERDLQRTRYDHIKARLILARETGTLNADDLIEVSDWLVAP